MLLVHSVFVKFTKWKEDENLSEKVCQLLVCYGK